MDKTLQDLAWSCLPKEFKEEVKQMWSVEVDCATKYKSERHKHRVQLLYELFGEHLHWQNNLTSDAEGEEMLIVSRSKVQNHYKHAIQLNNDSDSAWELVGGRIMGVLKDLFGSKCLPDNVDSLDSNIDSLEPKPAEPKFKRGGKAKIIGGNPEFIGKVVEIEAVNSKGTIVVYLPNAGHSTYKKDYLEPYTEPEGDTSPNVNISDIDIDELVAKGCVPDPAKQFDNILKDSFSKERRLTIAAQMMQGLICAPLVPGVDPNPPAEYLAQTAFRLADALLAEAEK